MSTNHKNLNGESIRFVNDKYQLTYDSQKNTIHVGSPEGNEIVSFPAEFKLSTEKGDIYLENPNYLFHNDELLVFHNKPNKNIETIHLYFHCMPDCILIGYKIVLSQIASVRISSAVYFQKGEKGLYMIDCLKAFSPTPLQEGFYGRFKPQVSTFSTFCPPPLNFSIGNDHGLVSFGLIDLPDSLVFGMTDDLGILVEEPGNKKMVNGGGSYEAPRLLVTFPNDAWQGLSLFREKLITLNFHTPTPIENKIFPEWWKKPMVCTYGDEIMELQYNQFETDDWDNPKFNSQWFMDWLNSAEERLGYTDFTIILDVFWQNRFSADPIPDENRFPNLRNIIDTCHAKGHHLLLWYAPFIDNLDLGFEPASKRFGVVSDTPSGVDNTYMIDFTHPDIQEYLAYLANRLFGKQKGDLDADGLKMDFLCFIRKPQDATYANPELGMGIKEQYRFYKLFGIEAAKVKKDVLLNSSVCDPRFEDIVPMNRLHDIHYFWWERELRARISALAAPGIIIDSDGAIMTSDWFEQSYIDAVLYGTPSLYYIRKFHDGVSISDEKMKALGRLLSLSSRKTNGTPIFYSYGNWQLINNQKVMGETIDGKTIILFDGKGYGYLFTWKEGAQQIQLHGREVIKIEPPITQYRVENDAITGNWKAGIVYSLTLKENTE